MKEFSYSLVPYNWAICYLADCPLAAQCLRRHAAMLAPETLTSHFAVLPAARKDDGTCLAFVADQPVQQGRGMLNLFCHVENVDVSALRRRVMAVFGSKTHFYRYRKGKYPVTTRQRRRAWLSSLPSTPMGPHPNTISHQWENEVPSVELASTTNGTHESHQWYSPSRLYI